jgi:hypothetical protein
VHAGTQRMTLPRKVWTRMIICPSPCARAIWGRCRIRESDRKPLEPGAEHCRCWYRDEERIKRELDEVAAAAIHHGIGSVAGVLSISRHSSRGTTTMKTSNPSVS